MMKRALLLLLAAGCSSNPETPRPEAAKLGRDVEVQAEDPEWRKIAEEAAKGFTVAEQQKLLESERHYQLALAWFNKADFEKARSEAQFAVQEQRRIAQGRRAVGGSQGDG